MPKRKRGGPAVQPHDAVIKHVFSQREHAAGLIKAALAPEITTLVRWSTLELHNVHFVDRGLRGRCADMLFSAEMGDERAYVYVLVEHQRKVESLMIFRMGAYMWRHWERLVRDEPSRQRLPAIIPILIHNSDTGWTAATAFQDIVTTPEPARAAMMPYIPRFGMKLVDVSQGPFSGLMTEALTVLGRVVLWCLAVAGDDQRLFAEIDRITDELNTLYADPPDVDALSTVVEYLQATHSNLGVADIAKLLATTARKGQKEITMDVLEELREDGRREGKREGELRGRARTLLELLAARFGAVPAKVKQRILAADEQTLSRWSIRVLTAPTLTAVLDEATATAAKKLKAPVRRPAARKRVAAAK